MWPCEKMEMRGGREGESKKTEMENQHELFKNIDSERKNMFHKID